MGRVAAAGFLATFRFAGVVAVVLLGLTGHGGSETKVSKQNLDEYHAFFYILFFTTCSRLPRGNADYMALVYPVTSCSFILYKLHSHRFPTLFLVGELRVDIDLDLSAGLS